LGQVKPAAIIVNRDWFNEIQVQTTFEVKFPVSDEAEKEAVVAHTFKPVG